MNEDTIKENLETLTINQVQGRLIKQKIGAKTLRVALVSLTLILCGLIFLLNMFDTEPGKFYITLVILILFLAFCSKIFNKWAKIYYNKTKYKPTKSELQEALKKEYKQLAKEKLQNALDKKDEIRKIEKDIKNSISEADEYIALGIESENIDVEQWCKENNWPQNPSTTAKAYDEEIGSLRTQLW